MEKREITTPLNEIKCFEVTTGRGGANAKGSSVMLHTNNRSFIITCSDVGGKNSSNTRKISAILETVFFITANTQ